MKPDDVYNDEKTKEEVWVLNGQVVHNSVGCDHYWETLDDKFMYCRKCGLGSFGQAEDGKPVSQNVIINPRKNK